MMALISSAQDAIVFLLVVPIYIADLLCVSCCLRTTYPAYF
jgi:hypothetical protein